MGGLKSYDVVNSIPLLSLGSMSIERDERVGVVGSTTVVECPVVDRCSREVNFLVHNFM